MPRRSRALPALARKCAELEKLTRRLEQANAEQLRTIDTFLDMGKAHDVRDLLRRQDAGGGMPWVNTTAADRAGHVLYADHSVVPNVSNARADLCMTPTGRLLNAVAGLPGLDGTRADSAKSLSRRVFPMPAGPIRTARFGQPAVHASRLALSRSSCSARPSHCAACCQGRACGWCGSRS